jgi:HAD superfamily hydrolase (TIGR01509 family)
MKIKGIILDLDGVYFQEGTKNFLDNVSLKFNISRDKVANLYLKSDEMMKYKRGEIKGKDFWNFFINQLEIKSNMKELLDILQKGYNLNPLAEKILHILKKDRIKPIICTNNFKERIDILNQRFNFLNDFALTIFSYDFGILKPELISKVIENSGLNPEEILFLDDSEKNIEGARKLGVISEICEDPQDVAKHLIKHGIKIE